MLLCVKHSRCIVHLHLHSTPSKKKHLCITDPFHLYNNLIAPSASLNSISHLLFAFSTFN
ncbi:hypothetical protein CLU79DRAFT_749344, partial [Phycomyces nitens]